MTAEMETPARPKVLITRLRAVNFRSLADVDVELGPLTVFVGPNASGKSNLLDALRFVRDALTTRLQQAVDSRGGISALRRKSSKGRPYDVTLEMELVAPQWKAQYGFTLGSRPRGEFRIKWERCAITYQGQDFVYESRNGRWLTPPYPNQAMMQLVARQASDEEALRALTREMEQVPPLELFLPRAALLLGIPAYTEVWDALRNMGFYALYPNTFREPSKPMNPYPFQDDGSNLTSTLQALDREYPQAYQRILDFLRAAVPDVRDLVVKKVESFLVGLIFHQTGLKLDLSQESDGTLRLLALFTALFQRPPRTLIGIEEPELNIHPGALAVLRDAMQLACRESQILVTTHSPELLAGFPPEVFRIVEMVNGATQVGPMAGHQREAIRERLFTPGELMVMEGLQREEAHA